MKELPRLTGTLRAWIITPDPDAVVIEGMDWDPNGWIKIDDINWLSSQLVRGNAFLNQGLQAILNRYAGIGGPPAVPSRIAASSDNSAVIATTTTMGGTFRSNVMNATFPSLSGQTLSFQSSFTKGAASTQIDFSIRKLGITNASTDAVGGIQDIIGGAGVSPYNEPLTVDLTGTTSFTFTPQIDCLLTAV